MPRTDPKPDGPVPQSGFDEPDVEYPHVGAEPVTPSAAEAEGKENPACYCDGCGGVYEPDVHRSVKAEAARAASTEECRKSAGPAPDVDSKVVQR